MASVCFYFKVHQPYRLKEHRMQGVSLAHCYADSDADRKHIHFLADHCYLPANNILYDLLIAHQGRFRISFSISGTALDLFQKYRPDVIRSFQRLCATGYVEILAETYYHSLSSLHSKTEFARQTQMHSQRVRELFDVEPTVFCNTALIHNNGIAMYTADLGYKGILCEGIERILRGRDTNQVYHLPGRPDFGLLLRNACLSDDIAFRFDDTQWSEHPLTAEKFAEWLHAHPEDTGVINLMLDYETFGIHKKKESGIFDFLAALPAAVLSNTSFHFSTPTDTLRAAGSKESYDVAETISWEDRSNGKAIWPENMHQNNTLKKIYSLEHFVLNCGHEKAIEMWGRLQAADYFYYMSELNGKTGSGHFYNPFDSAEEAFQNYQNIVADLEIALIRHEISKRKKPATRSSFVNALL